MRKVLVVPVYLVIEETDERDVNDVTKRVLTANMELHHAGTGLLDWSHVQAVQPGFLDLTHITEVTVPDKYEEGDAFPF